MAPRSPKRAVFSGVTGFQSHRNGSGDLYGGSTAFRPSCAQLGADKMLGPLICERFDLTVDSQIEKDGSLHRRRAISFGMTMSCHCEIALKARSRRPNAVERWMMCGSPSGGGRRHRDRMARAHPQRRSVGTGQVCHGSASCSAFFFLPGVLDDPRPASRRRRPVGQPRP